MNTTQRAVVFVFVATSSFAQDTARMDAVVQPPTQAIRGPAFPPEGRATLRVTCWATLNALVAAGRIG